MNHLHIENAVTAEQIFMWLVIAGACFAVLMIITFWVDAWRNRPPKLKPMARPMATPTRRRTDKAFMTKDEEGVEAGRRG